MSLADFSFFFAIRFAHGTALMSTSVRSSPVPGGSLLFFPGVACIFVLFRSHVVIPVLYEAA